MSASLRKQNLLKLQHHTMTSFESDDDTTQLLGALVDKVENIESGMKEQKK